MARATKERLAADAVRFGLGRGISSPAVEAALPRNVLDTLLCPVCKQPVRGHDRRQAHDCAMVARSCSGGGKIIQRETAQTNAECPDCGQTVALERSSKSSIRVAWFAAHGKRPAVLP